MSGLGNSSNRSLFDRSRRALLWLSIALAISGFHSLPRLAHSQSSNYGFTSSLKLEQVAPGVEYGQVTSSRNLPDGSQGRWLINVLRLDLKRVRLKVVRALDQGVGLETVSSLARRHRAVAAINGGYFRLNGPYRGESIGFLLIDGKLISEPYDNRAEVGLINEGPATNVIFGRLKYRGEIAVGRAKHSVQGVNRPLSANELIVFTPEFHRTTLTNPDGVEVVVRRSRVVAVRDQTGSTAIPDDGFVISAVGVSRDWIKRYVRTGAPARFSWTINSIDPQVEPQWRRAYDILSAGPQLIRAGKVALSRDEKTARGFATDRHPRTAVGKANDGKLLLVTVDGRQPQISIGMSLYELADLLTELGAIEAINLDGGGSTTMVVRDKIVNKPSDQTGERPVGDAIVVFPVEK